MWLSLAALTVSLTLTRGAAAPLTPQAVVAPLGWPGAPFRAQILGDGSVHTLAPALTLSEGLGSPTSPESSPTDLRFAWLRPGVRAVRATGTADGLELSSVTGIGPFGRPAPGQWLFRTLTLTNRSRDVRRGRLRVRVGSDSASDGLTVRRDQDVVAGSALRLTVSRKPSEAKVLAESSAVSLDFDFDLAPDATFDLLLSVPAAAVEYNAADLSDVRRLTPDDAMSALVASWQGRVVPSTITLGNSLVTEAYQAAVATLLLSPPPAGASARDVAAWLSALSRTGHGPDAEPLIESLLRTQRADGTLPLAADALGQAALLHALARYVLYSDDPAQWSPLLWPVIARAAPAVLALLGRPEPADAPVSAAAAAVAGAASVARLAGKTEQAAAWADRVRPLLVSPPATDWPALEALLRAQTLPGLPVTANGEDVSFSEQLVTEVADSVARESEGTIILLPALPLVPSDDGLLLELRGFPTGAGPVSFRLVSDHGGSRFVFDPLLLPKPAAAIHLYPPQGVTVKAIRLDDRPMPSDFLAHGPPWPLDRRTERAVLVK